MSFVGALRRRSGTGREPSSLMNDRAALNARYAAFDFGATARYSTHSASASSPSGEPSRSYAATAASVHRQLGRHAAAAQRDRTLIATYLSVADIERLRDQRVDLLEQQNIVTRQYIANLRAREARLMESVQRFRPYSPKPNAPALPEQIASEIVNTVKGLQVYEQELVKNTTERERVTREFSADISRFKELKGIK